MKELPIPMSAPMVRAILRPVSPKVVTRRIVRNQPPEDCGTITCGEYHPTVIDRHGEEAPGKARFGAYSRDGTWTSPSPYGAPGTQLWVREAWRAEKSLDSLSGTGIGEKAVDAGYKAPWAPIQYEADLYRRDWTAGFAGGKTEPGRLRLARFMPRWASRTRLHVTGVRVERLQDISREDAIAEGLVRYDGAETRWGTGLEGEGINGCRFVSPIEAYRHLWEQINGPGSWDENPWVWAIGFQKA